MTSSQPPSHTPPHTPPQTPAQTPKPNAQAAPNAEPSATSASTSASSGTKSATKSSIKRPPAINRATLRDLNPFRGSKASELVPQTRLTGPIPWVIAIMVTLTVIAAAGGLALSNVASNARDALSGGITVQIIHASSPERNRQAKAIEAYFGDNPDVAELRRVPDQELDALLEPWLGAGVSAGGSDSSGDGSGNGAENGAGNAGSGGADGGLNGALGEEAVPVPALIDLRMEQALSPQALAAIRKEVIAIAPSARVDAQSSWLAPVFAALSSLRLLSVALILLLGFTSAAAVWLAARSALGSNHDTIEIVHLLGGTDRQIARIFERSIAIDAAIGGAVGLVLGLIVVMALGSQFGSLGSGMVDGGGLGWFDWLMILIVPVLGVIIAVVTARLTVLSVLRRML